ncbi:MAG: deoxyribodipyrimidine photo-lyase, partial [Myxococcota bacterium]
MATQLVWLKRDLRLRDHEALAQAAARGSVIVLYVYEPSLWQTPEMDGSHLRFINECLRELAGELSRRGATLVTRVGEMPQVLDAVMREQPFESLWSHQETGNRLTYDRDLRVAAWCREHAVEWHEPMQHGVFRPLAKRDGWARKWKRQMEKPLAAMPQGFDGIALESDGWVDEERLGIERSTKTEVQPGGTVEGMALLDSFLEQRGVNYRADMSSPVQGWNGCSRLSPHLAWGSVSIREAYQK